MRQDFFNIQYSKKTQELIFSYIYFIITRYTATSSCSRSPEKKLLYVQEVLFNFGIYSFNKMDTTSWTYSIHGCIQTWNCYNTQRQINKSTSQKRKKNRTVFNWQGIFHFRYATVCTIEVLTHLIK